MLQAALIHRLRRILIVHMAEINVIASMRRRTVRRIVCRAARSRHDSMITIRGRMQFSIHTFRMKSCVNACIDQGEKFSFSDQWDDHRTFMRMRGVLAVRGFPVREHYG